MAPDQAIA
ncbi:hypothetical protein D047_3157A, partial [Vibrio parahaemolyticus VPTS-2010_2]